MYPGNFTWEEGAFAPKIVNEEPTVISDCLEIDADSIILDYDSSNGRARYPDGSEATVSRWNLPSAIPRPAAKVVTKLGTQHLK